MGNCRGCGRELVDEARFCAGCGAAVTPAESAPEAPRAARSLLTLATAEPAVRVVAEEPASEPVRPVVVSREGLVGRRTAPVRVMAPDDEDTGPSGAELAALLTDAPAPAPRRGGFAIFGRDEEVR